MYVCNYQEMDINGGGLKKDTSVLPPSENLIMKR